MRAEVNCLTSEFVTKNSGIERPTQKKNVMELQKAFIVRQRKLTDAKGRPIESEMKAVMAEYVISVAHDQRNDSKAKC